MRFKPHDRVLEILVGQELYTTADPAVRELLQNAEDACALQQVAVPGSQPEILVRFSASENWLEISDNGLGMNVVAVEAGFTSVGAPKTEVPHIRELLETSDPRSRQIAQFGIGVLSCFGVAAKITVDTKMDAHDGVSFAIRNYREEFEELPARRVSRGTTIRLELRPGGPMTAAQVPDAVERYVRHAKHVEIEDVDNSQRRQVLERWIPPGPGDGVVVQDPAVRGGFLALDPAWDTPGTSVRSSLLLSNGGFLVAEAETALLPGTVGGYVGELDIVPGELTILLNREGFKRDERWNELSQRLSGVWTDLIEAKLQEWKQKIEVDPKATETMAIDRNLILLTRSPLKDALSDSARSTAQELLGVALRLKLWGSDARRSVRDVIETARTRQVVFVVRQEVAGKQFQHSITGMPGSLQLTETAGTRNLRATHLRAKGYTVVSCKERSCQIELEGTAHAVRAHEADILAEICSESGVRCVPVESATPEEVELDSLPEGQLVFGIFGLESELKLVRLDGAGERVVRDFDGRLLNARHPEVKELLASLPDIMGNPVRRRLLEIYFDIDSYRLGEAREAVVQLLMDPDLAQLARLATGELTRDFLRGKLTSVAGTELDEE